MVFDFLHIIKLQKKKIDFKYFDLIKSYNIEKEFFFNN